MLRIRDIRNAVVQRLKDANIERIGQNVFPDRSVRFFHDELPAIAVYTRRNPCDDKNTNPTVYDFETDLSVETVLQGAYTDEGGTVTESDQLSFFSQQIVDTLIYDWDGAGGPLGGLVNEILLTGIYSSGTGEAEETIKGEVVKFSVIWNEQLPNAGPVNDFKRMGYSLITPTEAHAEDLDTNDVVVMDPEPEGE